MNVKRSTYYYQQTSAKQNAAAKAAREAELIQAICDIRDYDPIYGKKFGYRPITARLHELGYRVNHKHVLNILRMYNWLSTYNAKGLRKYNSYKGTVGTVARNLLRRRFQTDRPYQKLAVDVSEFRYGGMSKAERVYLEPVMDLFSGEILAYNISDSPTVTFAVKPLQEALDSLPELPYRTTVHTDQGFQYQNRRWVKVLKQHRVFQSMSRKGACLDNAMMESFFSVMKREVMDNHFNSKAELIRAMKHWIYFYNNYRMKGRLKGKSPVEYRKLALQNASYQQVI